MFNFHDICQSGKKLNTLMYYKRYVIYKLLMNVLFLQKYASKYPL